MNKSKKMQIVIENLAAKHGVNFSNSGAVLRLEMEGCPPLIVENIGSGLVSVAHRERRNRRAITDPCVIFHVDGQDWIPIEIQSRTWKERVALWNVERDSLDHIDLEAQADLAAFCETWARLIEAHDWLRFGKSVPVENGVIGIEMMALSVQQPHASAIASRDKTIEYRQWATSYRGPLLIVASKKPAICGLPAGQAVAVVQLADCCAGTNGNWEWVLEDAILVEPFPVQGQLRLYPVVVPATLLGQLGAARAL